MSYTQTAELDTLMNELCSVWITFNKAAKELDFERAMELRDIIFEMKVN